MMEELQRCAEREGGRNREFMREIQRMQELAERREEAREARMQRR
jgi:hypothetical protein